MENMKQNLGRDYLKVLRDSKGGQVELQPNDFLIMSPAELAAWMEEGEAKEYVLMDKSTEPKNKLNNVTVKIIEIMGEKLKVSVDGKETEIPTIFFQKCAESHINV